MTSETLEELRDRLLRQHNVQQMIQVRAYEIYRMRGGQPGGDSQDWFHAEREVLAFLIAHESAREDDRAETETAVAPASESAPEAPKTKPPRTRSAAKPSNDKPATKKKSATKRATPSKSVESKSKSKRIPKVAKTDETAQ